MEAIVWRMMNTIVRSVYNEINNIIIKRSRSKMIKYKQFSPKPIRMAGLAKYICITFQGYLVYQNVFEVAFIPTRQVYAI